MKKLGYLLATLTAVVIGCWVVNAYFEASERVADIVTHWVFTWIKGGVVSGIVIALVFLFNHTIKKEKKMNMLGTIVFPILVPILLCVLFGIHMWLIIFGILAGIGVGRFTSVVDDHLLNVWEIRHITLPIIFGLGFGASVVIAAITETWQDEQLFVTDHASCTEVIIKRYTYHKTKKSSYHSWDYYKSYYFFDHGEKYPEPKVSVDFTLGAGAWGKTDRYEFSHHQWVGGQKLATWRELARGVQKYSFKWIYILHPEKMISKVGVFYDIDENYFGQAKCAHVEKNQDRGTLPTDIEQKQESLPTESDVPGVFGMFWNFFKIMFTHPDFGLLRSIYVLIYLPFLVLMIFVQEFRISFWIFLAASSVVILLIIAATLARSGGRLSDLSSKRRSFSGFGGGRFGGGGANGGW